MSRKFVGISKKYPHKRIIKIVSDKGESVELSPKPSQEIKNHSPDGFNWGYGGSGPAQLALALIFEVTGMKDVALRCYQDFKDEFVASIPSQDLSYWYIQEAVIVAYVKAHQAGANKQLRNQILRDGAKTGDIRVDSGNPVETKTS